MSHYDEWGSTSYSSEFSFQYKRHPASMQWRMFEETVEEQRERIDKRNAELQRQDAEPEVELTPEEERLFSSIRAGRLPGVQSFVRSTQSLLNFRTPLGETPMILACRLGKAGIAQFLAEKVSPNRLCLQARDRSGLNALQYAAESGQAQLSHKLVCLGSEVEPDYELNQFAQSSGIRPIEMHRAMYEGFVHRCMFEDLRSADLALIPDVIAIVFEYLEQ